MKKDIKIALEITDSHVKCLQAKVSRGGLVVSGCDIKEIHESSDAHLSKLVGEIIFLKNISEENLFVVIPRRFAILKHLTLPSHDEEELKRMVSLQIVDKIPYSRDDIVLDYVVLNKDSSGHAKVLAIIVHKEVAQRYLKILAGAGLTPHKLVLSSLEILDWFLYQQSQLGSAHREPTAIINIDVMHSEVCLCYQENLLFSRNINYGARDLKPESISGFIQQMDLTIDAYRKQRMGPDITKIFIISTMLEASQLKIRFQEEYKLTVDILTPLDNLPCQKDFKLAPLWNQNGVSLTAGLGLLFSNPKKTINLLPQEIHHTTRTRLRKREWVKLGLGIFLSMILGMSIFMVDIYRDSMYLKQIQKKSDQIKSNVEQAERKIQAMRFIKEQFNDRILVADIVSELYNLMPLEISLRSFSLDSNGLIVIQGFGQTGASVNAFQSQLVSSPFLKDVTLQYATQRKRLNQDVTDFKITCQLSPGQSNEENK